MGAVFWSLQVVFFLSFTSAEQKTITAESGQNLNLTCRATDNNIIVVEWSRADLEPEYVLLYRDGHFELDNQHPSFKNRVDLQDRQMKDGDVSLILKNVTTADEGTYKCGVVQRVREPLKPISIITLRVVSPPGHRGGATEDGGFVGLVVGLSVAAVLLLPVAAAVAFLIYRKHKEKQDPQQPPTKLQPV